MTRILPYLLVFLVVLAPASRAGAAPSSRWRTMGTPHFEIHFQEGLYPVALRAARGLEEAHRRLVPLLESEPPRKTQVVLSDDDDGANGSAGTQGRPHIDLLAEPPDDLSVLGDYDDYVFLLVAHEYVHVLHLGTVTGLPSWLNWIFGDLWVPNGLQPRFITEGLATYEESQLSSAGRLRSALFEMYLRADVLEDRMLTLGQLSNGPGRWPWGTAWYLYGGKLLGYLAETRGDEAITGYSKDYSNSVIPYASNVSLDAAAGVDWIELYDEWSASLRERYEAQAAAIRSAGPVTVPELRTRTGERTMGPRWRGNEILYVEDSADRRPWLRALDLHGGDREVVDLGSSGLLAPLPDGRVVIARSEIHETYRFHGDLFVVDEDGERRVTRGRRLSEPDAWGRFAVAVQRGKGRTELARIDLRDGSESIVYRPPAGQQIYTPRISPDGARVVLSQSRAGPGRDLVVIELASGQARTLWEDTAIDLDPAWFPDGESIAFSSDRTGVFNLFEVSLGSGEIRRLTNVLTGAFQPSVSPDGSWIAWTTYSSYGFDVAASRLDSLAAEPAVTYVDDRPAFREREVQAIYPVRDYAPLETMAPQSWFPYFVADSAGSVLGASISGADQVGRHAWALSAGYGLTSGEPQGTIGYRFGGWHPVVGLAGSSFWRVTPGFSAETTERVTGGSLTLTFPWGSTRRSQNFTVGYGATLFAPLTVARDLPVQPEDGVATEVSTGWSFSSTERPAEAISAEDGVTASIGSRFGSTALGGDFDYAAVELGAGGYLRLPWARHHVLAVIGRAGIGDGDLGNRMLFGLGGLRIRDPLLDLLYTGAVLGNATLRGYEPGAFVGSSLLLGTVEYRFPLLRFDAGPWTLPLYAGHLGGAVFAEAGNAFDGLELKEVHPAAGAEVRLDVAVAGYGGALRLGYAHGFDVAEGGGDRFYLGIGTGF